MRKTVVTFLLITIMVSVSSGICFAEDGDGSQAYAEEQAGIAEMIKPVVYDRDYPQWGFRTHSWITGTGSETIAHTQLIDKANGAVIKEVSTHCNYVDYSGD